MPRWVKGFVVVAAAVLVLVVVVLVLGDGDSGHGPAQHLPGDGEGTTSSEEGAMPANHV